MTASDPSYVYYRLIVATALTRLAQALISASDSADVEAMSQRAIDLVEAASAKDPADARLRFELAMAYATMGDAVAASLGSSTLLTSAGENRSARASYERSLDVLNKLRANGLRAGGPLDDDERQLIAALERKISRVR